MKISSSSFLLIVSMILVVNASFSQTLPLNTMDYRGLWLTDFKNEVLGDTVAENELLDYAVANDLNYLICTNMFQILTDNCSPFTPEMEDLRAFIEKAHNVYNIEYISGNVGSDATAAKIQDYNNCSMVSDAQKFDMVTYECEFYNPGTNGSCPNFSSYITQLQNIKNICNSTFSSDPTKHLVCEVYIGGAGSTGHVLTNSSQSEMQQIASLSDHILITYYRSDPFQSSGNFFNWTITRLEWLASPEGDPNKIVLLLKSRNTDSNNMFDYLLTFPGTHYDALRDPYHSWVEGTVHNSSLTEGYIEKFNDGTYPWLTGIQVTGFTWFEHLANLEIADSLTSSVVIPEKEKFLVYPNPANQTITIDGLSFKEIEIWNSSGKIIKKAFSNTFSVSDCPDGLYFLKIISGKNNFFKKVYIHH